MMGATVIQQPQPQLNRLNVHEKLFNMTEYFDRKFFLTAKNCYTKGDIGGVGKVVLGFVDFIDSPRECQAHCQQKENCGYFVWRDYDGRCHFLQNNPGVEYSGLLEDNHISGPKECPTNSWTTLSPTATSTTTANSAETSTNILN